MVCHTADPSATSHTIQQAFPAPWGCPGVKKAHAEKHGAVHMAHVAVSSSPNHCHCHRCSQLSHRLQNCSCLFQLGSARDNDSGSRWVPPLCTCSWTGREHPRGIGQRGTCLLLQLLLLPLLLLPARTGQKWLWNPTTATRDSSRSRKQQRKGMRKEGTSC